MRPIRFDFCFYYILNLKLSPKQSLLYILQRLCGEVKEPEAWNRAFPLPPTASLALFSP